MSSITLIYHFIYGVFTLISAVYSTFASHHKDLYVLLAYEVEIMILTDTNVHKVKHQSAVKFCNSLAMHAFIWQQQTPPL